MSSDIMKIGQLAQKVDWRGNKTACTCKNASPIQAGKRLIRTDY